MMKTIFTPLAALVILFTSVSVFGAPKKMSNPDFTQGGKIPKNAKHDWNLGATGLRGWMVCDKMDTTDARQIAVTQVAKGSPADGIVAVGDVILGVGGKPFSYDPRTEMGKALTLAETEVGQGKLSLTRWRAGSAAEVVVQLPVLGTYSATAPYDCPKSKRLLEQGCKGLAKRMEDPEYANMDAIPRAINALALLASGEPVYLPLVKKEVERFANSPSDGMGSWTYGYVIMFLSEYKIATGDDSVMPGLTRLAQEAARGQSAVGSWGHRIDARPDGRLHGYGMMNAVGVPLTISLTMARKAGVKATALDLAIDRSAKLLRFYIGKGAIPYGDHGPWLENHENNGVCGETAVMFSLLSEAKGAEFFARMCVAAHGPERDYGHCGNYFNMVWSMPGVALSGPQATGAWMREFGTWYYDLARGADGSYLHQGPPEREEDSFAGWDGTGGYLLAYAMPLKKILLTGKQSNVVPQLDAAAAAALILDGHGWTSRDRTSAYDKLSVEQLLERLSSWSPIVRLRAADALGRRQGEQPVATLVKMLSAPRLETRYGACDALAQSGDAAAPAVPELTKLLSHSDLWLRIKAAETLAGIGAPAMSTVPILLERLAQKPTAEDPRGMEQRFLCSSVFGKMLKSSLVGVDQELLRKAVVAGLQNQDGHARGFIGDIYQQLNYEQIKPLLPAIRKSIIEPAPSGEMFADEIRVAGLRLLAQYHVEEGISACVKYTRDQNQWWSEGRTPELMKILLTYGTHAKAAIPELTKVAHYFEKEEKDFPPHLMRMKTKCVRDTIAAIEASTETPQLIRIERNDK